MKIHSFDFSMSHGFSSFVSHNDKLCHNLKNKYQFIKYNDYVVKVDLNEFYDLYLDRFVRPEKEAYFNGFIKKCETNVRLNMAEYQMETLTLEFHFYLESDIFKKEVNYFHFVKIK